MTLRETPAACASRAMLARKAWKSPPHCAAWAAGTNKRVRKTKTINLGMTQTCVAPTLISTLSRPPLSRFPTVVSEQGSYDNPTHPCLPCAVTHALGSMPAPTVKGSGPMPKAYWVTTYREIKDPAKLAAYAKLAPVALAPFGVRYLCRGNPTKTYESGLKERLVVSEFPSLDKAIAGHDSPGYQEALRALGDGAVRDIRIINGLE